MDILIVGLQSIANGEYTMEAKGLKEMIDYTKNWKAWLEKAEMKDEDEVGKKKLLDQMDAARKKWEKELQMRYQIQS